MAFRLSEKRRLKAIIAISFAFFAAELAVAFKIKSLALMADAFHYLNDLITFAVALGAINISEKDEHPQDLSFGWQRARVLGGFFNGVFLLALGISILLQSVERFIRVQAIDEPKLMLIMGCVGLSLNMISICFLHECHGHHECGAHSHDNPSDSGDCESRGDSKENSVVSICPHLDHRHKLFEAKPPGRDQGLLGVLLHVTGDAFNNMGVIIAAIVISFSKSHNRFYADPAASLAISIMIFVSALPLIKSTSRILLQSAPQGVQIEDIKHDMEQIPGVESVHELHVWRLDQKKAVASAHVVVADDSIANFTKRAKTMGECLHAYGVHSVTFQPELSSLLLPPLPPQVAGGSDTASMMTSSVSSTATVDRPKKKQKPGAAPTPLVPTACQLVCGDESCKDLMCCAQVAVTEQENDI